LQFLELAAYQCMVYTATTQDENGVDAVSVRWLAGESGVSSVVKLRYETSRLTTTGSPWQL